MKAEADKRLGKRLNASAIYAHTSQKQEALLD
jgi:hypothetical protein